MTSLETSGAVGNTPASMGRWWRIGVGVLLAVVVVAALVAGIAWRRAVWHQTAQIRFHDDVRNGFAWGQLANRHGLFRTYDLIAAGEITGTNVLDYTPGRLAVVAAWARWAQKHHPGVTEWENDYQLTRFMLRINTAAELASSVLVFVIVRLWVRRRSDKHMWAEARTPTDVRAIVRGLVGALLLWFNPAVVWNGHGFSQWDVWNMPFFLGAVLLASTEWWFAAGCCVVVGAFLKGQILLVAPIFLLWPIFQLRCDAAFRFICGFALCGAACAFPWLRPSGGAMIWFVSIIGVLGIVTPLALRSKRLPLQLLPHIYALLIAAAVFLMIPLFGASSAWYTQGFEFGTKKFTWMATPGTISFPALLVRVWRWRNDASVLVDLPAVGVQMQIRTLMLLVYGLCLVAASIGAAMQSRRRDTRFLLAMVAPWLCWAVLLTQLNSRYLMWAAGLSALLAGVSVGMTLLGIFVSGIGWVGIAQIMYSRSSSVDPETTRILNSLQPHLAWALLLAAAIYLYVAVSRRQEIPVIQA